MTLAINLEYDLVVNQNVYLSLTDELFFLIVYLHRIQHFPYFEVCFIVEITYSPGIWGSVDCVGYFLGINLANHVVQDQFLPEQFFVLLEQDPNKFWNFRFF